MFLRLCFLLSPEQYSFGGGRFQDGTRVFFIRQCADEEFCILCRGIPPPRWGLSIVWVIDPGDESPGYDLPTLRVCYGPKNCAYFTRQMPRRGIRTQPDGGIPAGDATPGIMRAKIISHNGAAEYPSYAADHGNKMPHRGIRTQPGGGIPAGDATPGIMPPHIISPNGAAEYPISIHTPTFLFSPMHIVPVYV